MTARDFASHVQNARAAGDGFTARCPAHDDRRASLSFRDGERGLLVKCHAGCSIEAIADALGLRVADLFEDNGAKAASPSRSVMATYPYRDETGTLLYEVVRFAPKDFRQRRPDGQGGWTWNLDGVRRVLYRLPSVKGQATVYIPEGEKDCDRLVSLGIPATTNSGGAEKWTEDHTAQLVAAGVKRVVVLPDNDPPGETHALTVARSCLGVGLTAKIVRLPGIPLKGDVSDWLDAGHTKEELFATVKATPLVEASDLQDSTSGSELPLTPLGDLLNEPEEECAWLVEGRLPAGGLSILAGKPKSGKSTLSRCLALAVSRGLPWLGFPTRQGPVFYVAHEEKRGEVRRHFKAMGATTDEPIGVFLAPSPEDGLGKLRRSAERLRPVLVIVDPLLKFIRVKDANDYAVVSVALEPLLTLARELGAHVLTVHHAGKAERTGGDAILGSTAIFGTVDTALMLKRTERYRTLSTIQRYGEDMEEATLVLDSETKIISLGTSRKEADEREAGQAILKYLEDQAGPMEEAAILEGVEGRRAVKVRGLRDLVKAGRVIRAGGGKRGDPYRYGVFGSLVPDISGEPEYQKSNSSVSGDELGAISGSREFREPSEEKELEELNL